MPIDFSSSKSFYHEYKRPDPLKAKFRIGNTHGPINYKKEENVFHREDIPLDKLKAKLAVQSTLIPNILNSHRSNWNTSTHTNAKICLRPTNTISSMDRSNMYNYNYRAEILEKNLPRCHKKWNKFQIGIYDTQKSKQEKVLLQDERVAKGYSKRMEEFPTHPDLVHKPSWNSSTTAMDGQAKQKFHINESSRKNNSFRKNRAMTNYISLEQRFKESLQNERLKKSHQISLNSSNTNKSNIPFPSSNTFKSSHLSNTESSSLSNVGNSSLSFSPENSSLFSLENAGSETCFTTTTTITTLTTTGDDSNSTSRCNSSKNSSCKSSQNTIRSNCSQSNQSSRD